MATATVAEIENNIRTIAQTNRVRISEFFLDFDKLRSGYVTETQFFRTLWLNLGVKMTPGEEKLMAAKYDINRNGRLNYRVFCDNIEKGFDPNDVRRDPVTQKVIPEEFLGTQRSVRPLSPKSESRLEELLKHMGQFYKYHGINLRTCYEDFDRHHIGKVTESQFYRNFPGPADVDSEDMYLLVMKYRDPGNPGLVVYLNLHHDLVAIAQKMALADTSLSDITNVTDYLVPEPEADPTLQQSFDKIRVAVFKNGVRTPEFFRDHDKLRSGIITENQFVCGLSLAIGKEAQLSRNEIQKIAEFYKTPDGRVRYKEFCDMMENAFNIPDLDKKPTESVVRPPRGALSRTLKGMTPEEEERVVKVVNEIADQVAKRRLMMYQYFKDFDRGRGYTRVITKTQFGRLLHFLSLNVTSEDFKLLCRKFEDPATGDVNYPAFVQTVDREFVGFTMNDAEQPMEEGKSSKSKSPTEMTMDISQVNIEDLLARIRHHVLTNRLRVAEYFQDYDTLRSGSISKSRFRRGLALLGLSKIGHHDLTDPQFTVLCKYYENTQKPDQVVWVRFLWDLESVFTQPNLEKMPTYRVPAQEIFRVPKPGTMDWRYASEEHQAIFEEAMERLRQRANQRRVLAKPVFQDFDRHNNGYVTQGQFRQCLTMLELHASDPEMAAIEAKFCNDTGFNYIAFLAELQPPEKQQLRYLERLQDMRATNQKKKLPELNICTDFESLIAKLKTKVVRERIRVLEFMRDYDKLRTGRMLKTSFRRALDLCKFELKESEVAILEDKYKSFQQPEYVEYLKFSDEMESVFTTKELEKAPMLDVEQFKPPVEWEQNQLLPEAEEMAKRCMDRLAEKVRKHRMQLFPLFEDYDRVHNGTVSRSQFRRVLSELDLGSLVSDQEFNLIYEKFDVKVGGKDDVNYIGFCDMIYDLAKFEWRKP
ncbi:uncharacterized protein LOC106153608 [Lingula anatina]|uniref:Uncharacterized protein LOC106153608 n=1 Tax=Lingula anatina TaxID=7574 RepID=A0A1S3HAM4_LINAN|nr:uncharacterized protein LOC106153608 [Lingula anatina]|eukprot:XP_013383058.1 uncharacterized protein LOC106153608 [Lingula anatina]